MKKIRIIALALIMCVAMSGCWRKNPTPSTAPSTVGPTTQATQPTTAATQPSVPSTNGTVPNPSGGEATTEGILPGMDDNTGSTGSTGSSSAPSEHTGDNARSMTRY